MLFIASGAWRSRVCRLLLAAKKETNDLLELTRVAVDEHQQGLGIGRRLIEAAIDEFTRREALCECGLRASVHVFVVRSAYVAACPVVANGDQVGTLIWRTP